VTSEVCVREVWYEVIVDPRGVYRPIHQGTANEVRRWFRENEWALMFWVRKVAKDEEGLIWEATVFMDRKKPQQN